MKSEISKRKKKINKGYLYVAPWVIGFLIFTFGPALYSIYISMTDWGLVGPKEGFVGLSNYIQAFQNSAFQNSLEVTIKYALFAVPFTMLSAFTAALLLNTRVKGLSIFRSLYYIPVITSGVAIAVMWGWILNPDNGLLNQFLGIFHLGPYYWLNDETLVIPSYVIMAVWGAFSGYLTYLVALKDIPNSLYDTAKMQGIGYFERLFKITIPLMRPILVYNFIMAIVASFRKFSEAYVLGGAGDQGKFYMVNFYDEAFGKHEMGYAVALAWILVVIVVALMLVVIKYTPFWEYYAANKKSKKGVK